MRFAVKEEADCVFEAMKQTHQSKTIVQLHVLIWKSWLCGRTMALDSRCVPSGETRSPVTVLAWPFSVIATSAFRRSHT